MPRSLFAGFSDYRSQSIEDMTGDLREWIDAIQFGQKRVETELRNLEATGLNHDVDSTFRMIVDRSIRFFENSLHEISDITPEIHYEVEGHHVQRLNRIGRYAWELEREIGTVWHESFQRHNVSEAFPYLQEIYREARTTAVDMTDLTNLAARLQHFQGRKSRWKKFSLGISLGIVTFDPAELLLKMRRMFFRRDTRKIRTNDH